MSVAHRGTRLGELHPAIPIFLPQKLSPFEMHLLDLFMQFPRENLSVS